jgi:hypothetical protein
MTDKPIKLEPYQRALRIMRAVNAAKTIGCSAVTEAVRTVVPDASDDEILQAVMVYLARVIPEGSEAQ